MYRIIDDVLSEENLIRIEQNVLEAPIFAAYESTASQHSNNVYDVMMSRVFFSSLYPYCEYDKEYLHYNELGSNIEEQMKNLDSLSSDFLLSIVTEKNMSLNTASSYAADLKIFSTFIKQQNLSIAIIRKNDIGKFFQSQRERGPERPMVGHRMEKRYRMLDPGSIRMLTT